MTYVMAGLYGELDKYREMMKKIAFGKEDILYVLGDMVDYGAESIPLLVELSMCENVYAIAGDHDFRALRMLSGFDRMLREGAMPDAAFKEEMQSFAADGGAVTLAGFRELDADMKEGVLDYLSELPLFEEAEVCGREYLLVHAGIAGFDPDKNLEDHRPEDFFTPEYPKGGLPDGRVLLVGHTPTPSGRIVERDGVIFLDCGVKDGKALGCLCLETRKAYYV